MFVHTYLFMYFYTKTFFVTWFVWTLMLKSLISKYQMNCEFLCLNRPFVKSNGPTSWNSFTLDYEYNGGVIKGFVNFPYRFGIIKKVTKILLITEVTKWLESLIVYKKVIYPNDKRYVTCLTFMLIGWTFDISLLSWVLYPLLCLNNLKVSDKHENLVAQNGSFSFLIYIYI